MADVFAFPSGATLSHAPDPALALVLDANAAASAAALDLSGIACLVAGGTPVGATDLRNGEVLTSLFTAAIAVIEAAGNPARDAPTAETLQRWLDEHGRIA